MAFRYLLFNKPFNVLCQFSAGSTPGAGAGRRTLADYISIPDVYPAGRLDFDSEGLVLLTDDGRLQQRVSEPRFGHTRTYWAQVEGRADPEAMRRLVEGVTIQGYRTRPAMVCEIGEPALPARNPPIRFRKEIPTSWLQLELTEGRNRQVRRMTAAVGLPTLRLVRSAIGKLTFEGLAAGRWRNLTEDEIGRFTIRSGR